jgi:hypothetical protein
MVVPARRSRELVIRGANTDASLQNRTPTDIVQVVNTAMGSSDAIAARTMQNGDVVLIFRNNAESKIASTEWMAKAFGESASPLRRKLAIITKNLSTTKLRNIYDEIALADVLRKTNTSKIARCRRNLSRNITDKYAILVLHISNVYAI